LAKALSTDSLFSNPSSLPTVSDYLDPEDQLMAAPIISRGDTLEPGTPLLLFQTRIVGLERKPDQAVQYDVTRNGRFLINTDLQGAPPITLIQNWQPKPYSAVRS